MQCPVCQYVSSDKNDHCPKCDVDLRPYKRDLGLVIINEAKEKAEEKPKKKAALKKNLDRTKKNILSAVVDDEELKRRVATGAGKPSKDKKAKKSKTAPEVKKSKTTPKKAKKKEKKQLSLEEQLKITVENQQVLIGQLITLLAEARQLDPQEVRDELCKIPTLPTRQDILDALDAVRKIDANSHPQEYLVSKALWDGVEEILVNGSDEASISIDHVIAWTKTNEAIALFDSADNALCGEFGLGSIMEMKSSSEVEIDNSELSKEFTRLEDAIESATEVELNDAVLTTNRPRPQVFQDEEFFFEEAVSASGIKIACLSLLASGLITPLFLVPENMGSLLFDFHRLLSFESVLYMFRWMSTALLIVIGSYHELIFKELRELIPDDED